MLGGMIGDLAGSRFEFHPHKSKEFGLFGGDGLTRERCRFTDDSVLTAAVAAALLRAGKEQEEILRAELIVQFHTFGKAYPAAGYGERFFTWLCENEVTPYGSFGNGSAMRVSPCGWYGTTLEECERLARISAAVTHDHPEGIRGAVAVAGAIYLARTGRDKEEIRRYVETRHYPHAFEKTLDEIRPDYTHVETCRESVPQALEAFYEAKDYEDAVRGAVSLGGDSDTLACIAGSIAEAFYGIPEGIRERADAFWDETLRGVTEKFRERYVLPCGDPKEMRRASLSPADKAVLQNLDGEKLAEWIDLLRATRRVLWRDGNLGDLAPLETILQRKIEPRVQPLPVYPPKLREMGSFFLHLQLSLPEAIPDLRDAASLPEGSPAKTAARIAGAFRRERFFDGAFAKGIENGDYLKGLTRMWDLR